MKEVYTREEVLGFIDKAFWDGIEQGGYDYAGDCFTAEDYLKEDNETSI